MDGTKAREEKSSGFYLIFVPIFFFAKRLIFISFLVTANYYLWVQVAILNFTTLASIVYMLWFRPLNSTLVEVLNDYTLLVLTYFLWCFTDIIKEPETRYELGYVFIIIFLGNLAFHMILMIT